MSPSRIISSDFQDVSCESLKLMELLYAAWVEKRLRLENDMNFCSNIYADVMSREGLMWFKDEKPRNCSRKDIQLVSPLHHGSFGDYVARSTYVPENRELAVKIVRILDRRSGRNDGRSIEDNLLKLRVANRMKHENIVNLYGFVVEEMTCYMLMEPMQASLSELIKVVHSKKLKEFEMEQLENFLGTMTVDVVDALNFLAEREISTVLTPRRILIDRNGRVKITVSAAITTEYSAPVRYSAPELLDRFEDLRKTGVWSYGVVMIETATGQHPFPGSIDFVIADMILAGDRHKLVEEFSKELHDFVDSCLTQSLHDRPTASSLTHSSFYKQYALLSDRNNAAKAILQRVEPHFEKMRRE